MKLDGMHGMSFLVGILVGWLVLPMVLAMFRGQRS
jgi:hypothetical protein